MTTFGFAQIQKWLRLGSTLMFLCAVHILNIFGTTVCVFV